jgi:hypothetical protein
MIYYGTIILLQGKVTFSSVEKTYPLGRTMIKTRHQARKMNIPEKNTTKQSYRKNAQARQNP